MKSFQLWTVLFFLISVLYHLFFFLVLHRHGHSVYPFSLNRHDRFYDFTIFTEKFRYFHTQRFFETGFPINYPAPVAVVFEFFFKYMAPHALFAFVTFCILSFVVPAGFFAKALIRRGIGTGRALLFVSILCLLSWPALLVVDGGNAEVIVWLAMLIGMWAYSTGRLWTAAIFFGVATSMKLFPVVFLALFLSRRHIGKLLAGIATFLVVSVVSLKVLGPTIAMAYNGIMYGLQHFGRAYMATWQTNENGVDHSLFALIKMVLFLGFHHPSDDFTGWLRIYLIATAVGGVLLYFLRIRKQPLLNQVLVLSIVSIYFTAFSGDGTLIHLYYPLILLFFLSMQAYGDGVTVPGLSTVLYCMVFCLSVESFLVIAHKEQGARFIGPAHCVALGIMLIAALRYPLGPPLVEERGEVVLSQPVTGWVRL